jgi:tetraacyldisaccharide 4'-kinase
MLDETHDLRKEPLLPAGRLREPIGSLTRADLLVLTSTNESSVRSDWVSDLIVRLKKPVARAMYVRDQLFRANDRTRFEGNPGDVVLFSGIGRHERFVATARQAGLGICADRRFPDHHVFTGRDEHEIAGLLESCRVRTCVTTEKDVSRLPRDNDGTLQFLKGYDVLYLPVSMKFVEGGTMFHSTLDECMNQVVIP